MEILEKDIIRFLENYKIVEVKIDGKWQSCSLDKNNFVLAPDGNILYLNIKNPLILLHIYMDNNEIHKKNKDNSERSSFNLDIDNDKPIYFLLQLSKPFELKYKKYSIWICQDLTDPNDFINYTNKLREQALFLFRYNIPEKYSNSDVMELKEEPSFKDAIFNANLNNELVSIENFTITDSKYKQLIPFSKNQEKVFRGILKKDFEFTYIANDGSFQKVKLKKNSKISGASLNNNQLTVILYDGRIAYTEVDSQLNNLENHIKNGVVSIENNKLNSNEFLVLAGFFNGIDVELDNEKDSNKVSVIKKVIEGESVKNRLIVFEAINKLLGYLIHFKSHDLECFLYSRNVYISEVYEIHKNELNEEKAHFFQLSHKYYQYFFRARVLGRLIVRLAYHKTTYSSKFDLDIIMNELKDQKTDDKSKEYIHIIENYLDYLNREFNKIKLNELRFVDYETLYNYYRNSVLPKKEERYTIEFTYLLQDWLNSSNEIEKANEIENQILHFINNEELYYFNKMCETIYYQIDQDKKHDYVPVNKIKKVDFGLPKYKTRISLGQASDIKPKFSSNQNTEVDIKRIISKLKHDETYDNSNIVNIRNVFFVNNESDILYERNDNKLNIKLYKDFPVFIDYHNKLTECFIMYISNPVIESKKMFLKVEISENEINKIFGLTNSEIYNKQIYKDELNTEDLIEGIYIGFDEFYEEIEKDPEFFSTTFIENKTISNNKILVMPIIPYVLQMFDFYKFTKEIFSYIGLAVFFDFMKAKADIEIKQIDYNNDYKEVGYCFGQLFALCINGKIDIFNSLMDFIDDTLHNELTFLPDPIVPISFSNKGIDIGNQTVLLNQNILNSEVALNNLRRLGNIYHYVLKTYSHETEKQDYGFYHFCEVNEIELSKIKFAIGSLRTMRDVIVDEMISTINKKNREIIEFINLHYSQEDRELLLLDLFLSRSDILKKVIIRKILDNKF